MLKHTARNIAATRKLLGVPDEQIPRSIAIIMDGNGRWARQRDLPRHLGHRQGADSVDRIVTASAALGLEALSLYSFSIENWSRPRDEVNTLMHLYAEYLIRERPNIMENNIRLKHLGQRNGLPDAVLRELDETIRISTNNTGMILSLAVNYGSRTEIVEAVRQLAQRTAEGDLAPADIDEEMFSATLDTAGVLDPDLLIRTAGEMRISNYLLWQISYAELYVTDVFWPDFDDAELHKAIQAFAARHRRFGGVDESNT